MLVYHCCATRPTLHIQCYFIPTKWTFGSTRTRTTCWTCQTAGAFCNATFCSITARQAGRRRTIPRKIITRFTFNIYLGITGISSGICTGNTKHKYCNRSKQTVTHVRNQVFSAKNCDFFVHFLRQVI